ncbi:GNAT family N-acetyltransferase [Roseovarius sp. A21]|uniref:GNAT family N-acetyltransferase n=1 Tax=Roseovarius bejariae TaxID=2576383 RepID=A0A844CUF8_9RHOB|nr:GNAT family N-acetyltransferase [Roseovarius bejariae]MRU17055.1 GNAT family N-acetyltransferase [Roseovarius bejariae]
MLEDGMHGVPAGHTASVVTHLEMKALPNQRVEAELDLELMPVPAPDPEWYLDLFRKVGAPWLWFGRLVVQPVELKELLSDARVHVHVLRDRGEDVGLLELDFRQDDECELAYFGLTSGMVGTGAGRWLMNRAIALAWAQNITRFHVHTCTLDHPEALDFYRRSGFTPYKREIEIAPDPRLTGLLPRDAAPHVPLIA